MTCNSWDRHGAIEICLGCGRTVQPSPFGETVLHEGSDPEAHAAQQAADLRDMLAMAGPDAQLWDIWRDDD